MPAVPGFRNIRLLGRSTTGFTQSVFTGEQQVFEHQGEWWEAEAELPAMIRANAEEWIAFLLALRGKLGTFLLGDSTGKVARGTASGVTVNGGSQVGKTLALSGSGTLKKGDYLQIGTGTSQRLYKCLEDATLGATVTIFPRLRESPTNGAAVTLASAKGLFRLATPQSEWDANEVKHYGITFQAVEAF
jgi:hypothetical protein